MKYFDCSEKKVEDGFFQDGRMRSMKIVCEVRGSGGEVTQIVTARLFREFPEDHVITI